MPDQSPPRPRGALPTSRHKLCASTPYRTRGTTPANFAIVPTRLSYWLNNIDGDCVTAEEAFAKACHNPEIFIQDSTVQAFAEANNALHGAELLHIMQVMETDGFMQDGCEYNNGTPTSIDYTDAATLQNAISQGPVKIGIAASQLEKAVTAHNGWFATGFHSDQNEDHCVSLCGYGTIAWLAQQLGVSVPSGIDGSKPGYLLFTWNTVGIIDAPSMVAITGEAWLRTPTTIVIGPTPTPTPVPPPTPTPTPVPVPPPHPGPVVANTVGDLVSYLAGYPSNLPVAYQGPFRHRHVVVTVNQNVAVISGGGPE